MSLHNPSDSSDGAQNRNAYWVTVVTALGAILAGASLLLLPISASAFWLFSPTAYAANPAGDPPLVPSTPGTLGDINSANNSDPDPFKGDVEIAVSGDSALVANSGPEGTLPQENDAISTGGADTIASYTVKDGDSISKIADSFGVSVNTILWANNLTSKSTIKPGMTLIVLPVSGIQHTVLKGETLASLAKKYNGDANEIETFNGLDGGALVAGSVIIIPGGSQSSQVTAPKKKTGTAKSPATPSGLTSGGGNALSGFWTNPLPGGILTQGIHDNNAVDIGAPSGTPIYAAAGGEVIFVSDNGSYNHGWGNDVIINHANGAQTLYSHMSRVAATDGESVSAGALIGYVGETGRATGNHLHFEVHGARNPFAGCSLMSHCSP